MYYVYLYLDPRKKGSYSYGDFHFEYEPFYVGKGIKDRYLSHLRIAMGTRKGKNNKIISKIKSIINDGSEPIIFKFLENLNKDEYNTQEIYLIKSIGKYCDNSGPLLNITDGGDGGITWAGEHHNKNKSLEDIVGYERSIELKKKISEDASKRIGELNPNFGNVGEMNPNYGRKHTEEELKKMSESARNQFASYSEEEINLMIKRMNDARVNISEEEKKNWDIKKTISMKAKYESGQLFKVEHRQKLKDNNYKKLNKGSDDLKLSEETKEKISKSLKNRVFTSEHREKLRKCISFYEFEIIIIDLVKNGLIKSITSYRKYAKENTDLKYSIEETYNITDFKNFDKNTLEVDTEAGALNTKRPIQYSGNKIQLLSSSPDFDIGKMVTDITLKGKVNKKNKEVYLSLKTTSTVTFFNVGVKEVLTTEEIKKKNITNKNGLALLKMLNIDPAVFCDVYNQPKSFKGYSEEINLTSAKKEKLKSFLESGIGYGYTVVHQIKKGNVKVFNVTKKYMQAAAAPQSMIVYYGGKGGSGKRVDIVIETEKYTLGLNIRDTQGKDGYPTRLMCNFSYK